MKLNFLLILFLLVGCTVARDGYGNSPHGSNYQLVCSFEDTFSCKICQGINTSDQKQKEECRLTEKQKAFNLNLDKALIDKVNQVGIKQPQKIKFLPLTIALDLTKPLTNDRNLPIYSLKTLKAEEISKKQNNPTGLGLVWKYKITKKDSPKQVAKIDQQCPGPKSSKEFCRHYKEGKTYYYLRQVVVECHGQGEKCVARLESLLPKENQKTLEAQTSNLKKSSPAATKIAEKPANTTKSKEKVIEERSPSKSPVAKPEEPSAKTDKPEVKPEVKPDAKVTNGQPSCGNDCYQVELVIHQQSFLKEEDSQATLPSKAFFKWPGDNTKTQRFVNNKKDLKFQLPPPKKDTDIDSWLKQEYGIISVTPARYRLVYQTYKPDPVNQRQLRLDYLWQDTTDKVLLVYYPVQPETSYRTGLEANLLYQMDCEFENFLAQVQDWGYSRIYIRFTDLGKPVQYTKSTLAAYLFKPAYESKDYAWSEQRVVADYDTLIKNQGSQIDLLYFSAESPSQLKKQFAPFAETQTKVYVFTTGYSSEKSPISISPYLQIHLLDKTKLTVSKVTEIFNTQLILDFFSGGK